MKKRLVSMILAVLMTSSLVACGSNEETNNLTNETTTSESGYSVDEIKINIWDNNQREGLQQIADKWTETSGVKVSIEVVDWDNYWTLLEAGASGGVMPDVFWMHSNTAQMYMENDILLDLTSYIEADDTIKKENYYEGVWNLYSSNGKQYALPKDHDTIALLYNKAIFDQYNVAHPTDDWTWEDMYEAAKSITEGSNGEVYGMAMNTSNNQDGWYNLVYSHGAQVITDDHKGTTIASDEGKAGMEMMRKLLTVGAPQTIVAETGTDSLFKSGKTAMITQGSWMINSFYTAENAADYAWAMLPYADVNENATCDKGERYSAYNGDILLTFVINAEKTSVVLSQLAQDVFNKYSKIKGVCANFNTSKSNIILGRESELICGESEIEEKILDKTFKIGANTFFQVNPKSAENIFKYVKEEIEKNNKEPKVLDAYAGIASFGIVVCDVAKSVLSVEENPNSTALAQEVIKLNNIQNVEVKTADTGKFLETCKEKFDVIILDPPRKGCDKRTLDESLRLCDGTIIYVSCNPATLARDLKYLKENGCVIKSVKPFDMFCHTLHVENVAIIETNKNN